MTNVILPFLTSMLLGRTIDLTSYTISGVNVYDDADYDETTVNNLTTTYIVLQEDAFPYTFFGVSTDIALRIKSNFLSSSSGVMGLDGALKDTSWKYNSVVVAAATVYRTVDRSLKTEAAQLPEWSQKIPPTQTHYAESLFYGGWSLVLFQLQCDIPSDVLAVRKVINEHLGVVGSLTGETMDEWKAAMAELSAHEDIRGSVKLSTHVYSTVPFNTFISSPETLVEAIQELPSLVGNVGQPLYMNLKPLKDLDNSFPTVKEDVEMLSELEKLDEMFDDVKLTKVSMMRWMTETMTAFNDDEEQRISEMLNVLNECIRAFNKFSADVSLFKPTDHNLLDSAFHMYLNGLQKGVATYNLAFRRLKEEIDAECTASFLHKIRGLLRVYEYDVQEKGMVEGGLEECQKLCLAEPRCRSIGYAPHLTQLDLNTGLYLKKEKVCWIYMRSTSTASVYSPSGYTGDMGVYDRTCY